MRLIRTKTVIHTAVLVLWSIWATQGRAQEPLVVDELAGVIEAEIGGQKVILPTLATDIKADIQGDLATVTVIQTFANPFQQPLHATYLFPLNQGAAVYQMTMAVGDELVRAQIQKVEQARRTFEKAKREGKAAALLTQHRPNMFTHDIANLMPGLPIEVTLRYVQTVPKVDGAYELVIPLVVGPRFQPASAGIDPQDPEPASAAGGVPAWNLNQELGIAGGADGADSSKPFGQWELEQLPAYPPVSGLHLPDQIDAERVALEIDLNGGMPVASVSSDTHELLVQELDPEIRSIELAAGLVVDNRDFVLRYSLAGADNQAGLLDYADERGGFFSILIEPPATVEEANISPREMVFVLDASGSMGGLPMDASKAFMRESLRNLRPTDSFRIIRFSDAATEFSSQPLTATPANIQRGIGFTNALQGQGGTVMSSGIYQALSVPAAVGTLRIVVFLTDGYIGNEAEILRMIGQTIGDARLYAFGVGTGTNRYLLDQMGRVGRGFTRYMDPTEDVDEVAAELVQRLQSPVLTDIHIDWGGLAPTDVMPQRIPDLFAGQSVRVQGRYDLTGDYEIEIEGFVNGRRAALPLAVSLTGSDETATVDESGEAVALIWARSAIKEAMHQLLSPPELREDAADDDDIKNTVTQLGLDYSLVTRWTSFVAVSEKAYNQDPGNTQTKPVPLPKVAAVPNTAYAGGATPEPETWLGLLLLLSLSLVHWMRRRPIQ